MKEIEIYNGQNPDGTDTMTKVSIIKAYGHTLRLTICINWVGQIASSGCGYSQIENLADDGWHTILTTHDETMTIGLPSHRYKGEVYKEDEDGCCDEYDDKFIARQNAITNGWKAIIKHLYAPEEE